MFIQRLREFFHRSEYRAATKLIGPGPARFLDIGCGRPCETMPDYALSEYAGAGVYLDIKRCASPPDGCIFVQSDAQALPFKAASFDNIMMLETIEHVRDVDLAMAQVSHALRDDGVVVLSTPSNNILWRATWFLWERTFGRYWFGTHNVDLDRKMLVGILRRYFDVEDVVTFWGVILIIKARKKCGRQRRMPHGTGNSSHAV